MSDICVAGIHINIESDSNELFNHKFAAYLCNDKSQPDIIMKSIILDEIAEPDGISIQQIESVYIKSVSDGGFCRYLKSGESGYILYAIYYSRDYTRVRIALKRDMLYRNLNAAEREYLFTGFMFANRITYLGGTVLHSSAISYDNQGIIFSADSGIGKSTHASLWQNKFGNHVTIINDDKPAIRFINHKAYVYGTPWSGKTNLNNNICVLLKAIVFLERGADNQIEKMSVTDGVLNLTRQMPNPFYDESIGELTVNFTEKLYSLGIPIYRLKCNISDNAVDTVYDKVFR